MADATYFGICDAKGLIICDPVFHKVSIIEKDGAKLYEFIKYVKSTSARKDSKITLARPDGSWADEYDEIRTTNTTWEYPPGNKELNIQTSYSKGSSFMWRSQTTTDFICVRKGTKWGLINYLGKEIIPCVYNDPLYLSEGLASVVSDDRKTISFIDSNGKTVLGPYQTPPPEVNIRGGDWGESRVEMPLNYGLEFSEGKVRFYKDGKFGVIDKSGNIVIEAKYDYISAFSGGTAMFISGGKNGVIDVDGNVLLEATEKYLYFDNKPVSFNLNGTQISVNLHTGVHNSDSVVKTQTQIFTDNGVITVKNKDGKTNAVP